MVILLFIPAKKNFKQQVITTEDDEKKRDTKEHDKRDAANYLCYKSILETICTIYLPKNKRLTLALNKPTQFDMP